MTKKDQKHAAETNISFLTPKDKITTSSIFFTSLTQYVVNLLQTACE